MDLTGMGAAADSIMGGLDKLFTSDDERLKGRAIIAGQLQKFQLGMESELTKRQQADMASDNGLSKNIRPGTLILSLLLVVLCYGMEISGNPLPEKMVNGAFLLAQITTSFYFGSRGIEKMVANISQGRRKKKKD
jgi:hypothetical protein